MSIEQNITDSLLISMDTGIPVLFMSNPGLGKTTILKRFASQRNMHLETLIGSRFTPEEISGYQVNNGGDHLEHINPQWYSRILKETESGKQCLLFIDELSTCSENVQGALLSLIFDRSISGDKKLPENCIIVSAANYAANLPAMMNIMAPTLNRFAIVNLNDDYNAIDMIDEFLTEPKEVKSYKPKKLSDKEKNEFMERYRESWKEIFIKYSDKESSVGILDISNPALDGLYSESSSSVYNFISGRTLYYLGKVLLSYKCLGINNKDLLKKLINGLVGRGTNNFKDKKQYTNYVSYINSKLSKLLTAKSVAQNVEFAVTGNISADVQTFLFNRENMDVTPQDEIRAMTAICNEVIDKFKGKNIVTTCTTEVEIARFISDLDAITELYSKGAEIEGCDKICSKLQRVSMNYYGLYCDVLGMEVDYRQKFGSTNSFFTQVVYVKRLDSQNKPMLVRAGLRYSPGSSKPSFYLIESDQSFMEAKLGTPINRDSILGVVAYENKSLRFIKLDDFFRRLKQ